MKAFLLVTFFLFHNIISAQIPVSTKGKLVYFKYSDSKYIESREIVIWLPANYVKTAPCNLIYMHDAASLFDTAVSWNHETWEIDKTMQKLIDSKKINQCIIVGIYNASLKRRSEYFPQKAFKNLSALMQDSMIRLKDKNNKAVFNGALSADNYLKFIVNELKPYIDSTFNTYKDAAHTYIAGSSMGALISLYALCEYPSIFGGAACLSTHWTAAGPYSIPEITEAILLYYEENLPSNNSHKIYFDYGSVGLDSLYKPYQNKIDKIMRDKFYDDKHWITKEFLGAGHDEKSWSERLNIPLEFILKPE
jgi:enterochelin esterase-like enzyme